MEYNVYLLIIEFVGLGALVVVWFRKLRQDSIPANNAPGRSRSAVRRPQKERFFRRLTTERREISPKPNLIKSKTEPNAEEVNVPIPWGWPHYLDYRGRRQAKPSLSDSMHSLLNCLVREKQLACEGIKDIKISNSVRALLEDRYHRVDRNSSPAQSSGHGQDLNPSGMGAPLDPATALRTFRTGRATAAIFRQMEVRELRRPWGW